MGRAPCCEKVGLKKGRWTSEEDELLVNYIKTHGEGSWRSLPKNAGLLRCGKSCRLRWINYLREDLKRGNITQEEEDTIIKLQASLGNRWSAIAAALPGRTDNEIKNYWNAHLIKKAKGFSKSGTDLEGAAERKRKRVDSDAQQGTNRRKAKKVRSQDGDSKGGDKGFEQVAKKKKGSRRKLQKQQEEVEKHHIAPKNGEVEEEEEEEEAITLTTSTITVEEVLQIVDDEVPVPVPEPTGDDEAGRDCGFELLQAGLEEEINSDIQEVGIIADEFWPLTDHEEKESGGKTTNINDGDNNNTNHDGNGNGNGAHEEEEGIGSLFRWEGLEDIPWEEIGDTWQLTWEGNGDSSDSPSTVIDGHDPFEDDLESWLFSDIV